MSVPKCCDALGIVSTDEVVPENWRTTWNGIRTEMVNATTGKELNELERAALTVRIFQLLSEEKDTECQGWLINKVVKQIPAGAHALRTDILSLLPKHLLICYLDVRWALEGNAGTAGQWLDDIIGTNPHGVDNAGFVCYLIVNQPMRGWPTNSKNQLTTKIQGANAIHNSMNEWNDCARVANHCLCNGFEGSRNQVLELVNLRNQEVGNRKAVKWMMCLPDVRDCYKALLGLNPFVAAPAPATGGPPMTPVTPRPPLAGAGSAIHGPIAGKTYRFLQIADDFVEQRREFHGRADVLGNLSREQMFGTGDNPYFHPKVVLGEEVHMLKWRLSLTSIVEANSHLTPVMPLTYQIGGHTHRLQEYVLGPTVSRHFPDEDDALLAANLVYILSYGQINGFHDTYGGEAAYKAFLKAAFFLACWKYAKRDVSAIPPSKQTYVQLELHSVEKQRFDAFEGYVLQHHGCHLDREDSSQFKTFAGDNTSFASKLGSLKGKMSSLVVSSSYQPTAQGPNSTANLKKGLYFEQWMSLFSLMGDGTDADAKTVTLPVISKWKIGGTRENQRDATFFLQSLKDDDRPDLWQASYKMGLLGLSAGGVNDIQQSQTILDRNYSPGGVPTAVKLAMFTADPPAIHVLPGTAETPGTKNMITPFESTPRVGFGSTPSCKRSLSY